MIRWSAANNLHGVFDDRFKGSKSVADATG